VPVYIFRSGNDAATGNEGDCLDPAGRNAGIWSEEGGDCGRDLGDGYNEIGVDRGQFLCVDVGDSPPAPERMVFFVLTRLKRFLVRTLIRFSSILTDSISSTSLMISSV